MSELWDYFKHSNSNRLPLLDKFICKVSNATPLLHAIVAPRLAYFEYSPGDERPSEPTVFTELGSKFSSVSHLVLCCTYLQFKQEGLHSAFPDVRHMKLLKGSAYAIFESTLPPSTWRHLKYLSINSGEDYYEYHTDQGAPDFWGVLANWLQLRQNTDQSVFQIKISSFSRDAAWISNMHDALHGLCVLEWADNAFKVSIGLSGISTTPWLVNELLHILLISGLTLGTRTWYLYLLASQPVSVTHFWRVILREASSNP